MNSFNKKNKILYVLDINSNVYDYKDNEICLIDSYDDGGGEIISLPSYIEDNDRKLRYQYLDLIQQINSISFFGKNINEHLNIDKDFSLWQMSPINERNLYIQPISLIIKAFAFREILLSKSFDSVHIDISDYPLAQIFETICKEKGMRIEFKKKNYFLWLKEYINNNFLSITFRGLIYFIKVLLKQTNYKQKQVINSHKNALLFFSPLTHLKEIKGKGSSEFNSELWDGIPDIIIKNKMKANWVHTFSPSGGINSEKQAYKLLNDFNLNNNFTHFLMGTGLSFRIVLKAFRKWLKFTFYYMKVKSIKGKIFNKQSDINFWPLLQNNIYQSFTGYRAAYNLLIFYNLEELFSELPEQESCFYLYENQSWEKALIYYYRKYSHRNLYAVIHSTVRIWDMRHFYHPEMLNNYEENLLYLPDYFLVNGNSAKKLYIDSGMPVNKLIESEALRYRNLYSDEIVRKKGIPKNEIILFLDYSIKFSINMMKFIEKYDQDFKRDFHYLVKPHINAPINLNDFKIKNASLITDNIKPLLKRSHTAICSNMTSAQIDALIMGVNVIVFLDGKELNLSPLKEHEGVNFVKNSKELDKILFSKKSIKYNHGGKNFFFNDLELARWKKLIKI